MPGEGAGGELAAFGSFGDGGWPARGKVVTIRAVVDGEAGARTRHGTLATGGECVGLYAVAGPIKPMGRFEQGMRQVDGGRVGNGLDSVEAW